MINQIKSQLEQLETIKKETEPKRQDLNREREEEIEKVNKKYDHLIYECNYEIEKLKNSINNMLIDSFIKAVMREFDLKRSTSEYSVSEELINYKKLISQFTMFPKELIERLHQVINGIPIENVAYDLDEIEKKYKKS